MAWNGSESANGKGGTPSRPQSQKSATGRSSHFKYVLLMGLALVIGGGVAAYVLFGPRATSTTPSVVPVRSSQIAEVATQITTQNVAVTVVAPPKRDVRLEQGVEVIEASVSTNKNGAEIEYLKLADGRTMRKIRPPKPLFDNPADQLIAMSVSAKPGESMPPLPDLSNVDDDFAQALLSPIRIEETDSDEVKDLKSRVIEARAYLVEEVKNGGTVREALRRYQADMEKYADSHAMAAEQINEIRKTEGEEAATEFRNRINEAFRARGIPEIEVKDPNDNKRNPMGQSNE